MTGWIGTLLLIVLAAGLSWRVVATARGGILPIGNLGTGMRYGDRRDAPLLWWSFWTVQAAGAVLMTWMAAKQLAFMLGYRLVWPF